MASSDYVVQYLFSDIAAEVASQAPQTSLEFRLWEPSLVSSFSEQPIDLVSTIIETPSQHYHLFWHQLFSDDLAHHWFRRLALSFLKDSFDKSATLSMSKKTSLYD